MKQPDLISSIRDVARSLVHALSRAKELTEKLLGSESNRTVLVTLELREIFEYIESGKAPGSDIFNITVPEGSLLSDDELSKLAMCNWQVGMLLGKIAAVGVVAESRIDGARLKWPTLTKNVNTRGKLEPYDVWREIDKYIFELHSLANFIEHEILNYPVGRHAFEVKPPLIASPKPKPRNDVAIESDLSGQSLVLFQFLQSRHHATEFATLRNECNAWRNEPSDDAIEKALKRLRNKLTSSTYTVEIENNIYVQRCRLVNLDADDSGDK